MSQTRKKINDLQRQYDTLQAEADEFTKNSKGLEARIREEVKKKMQSVGADRDDIVRRKGEVHRQLVDAQNQRVGEIVAEVATGTTTPEEAVSELGEYGYSPAAASSEIARALNQPLPAVSPPNPSGVPSAPNSVVAPIPAPTPPHIVDPISGAKSDSQPVVYRDGQDADTIKRTEELRAKLNQSDKAKLPDGAPIHAHTSNHSAQHANTHTDESPVTANHYANVSKDTIAELIEANDAAIKALPDAKAPESRKEAIDLLVRAGIRPPKKSK